VASGGGVQTMNALAIAAGIVPAENIASVASYLASLIRYGQFTDSLARFIFHGCITLRYALYSNGTSFNGSQQYVGHLTTGVIGTSILLNVLSSPTVNSPQLAFQVATQLTYPSWGKTVHLLSVQGDILKPIDVCPLIRLYVD